MNVKNAKDKEASRPDGCPRRIDWIRVLTGEASAQTATRMHRHAQSCERCRALLDSLEIQQDAFLQRHPPERLGPELSAKARERIRTRRRITLFAPAAAAIAVLVVVLSILPGQGAKQPGIRTKGAVSLEFFVQKGDEVMPGESGGIYRKDDRIQFVYSSGANRFLFLVSLDERGRVSNFNHQASSSSVAILPGNQRVLEGSIILDDTRGLERVFAIFSNHPLQLQEIEQAARQAFQKQARSGGIADLEYLPLPYPQATILLHKK
jgi:hypothetical protein